MDVVELVSRCRALGAVFVIEGDRFKVNAPAPLPDDLRDALRAERTRVLVCLRLCQPGGCANPFTEHRLHEFPWECDPDACLCQREWGRPELCRGVPCRWIWPDVSSTEGDRS
jgi:hypothetical protein